MVDAPQLDSPSPAELAEFADSLGLSLSPAESEGYAELVAGQLTALERLEELSDRAGTDRQPVVPDARSWRRPGDDENPCNAFASRCRVTSVDEGPLTGYRVALKDNISLAGVRMACGSAAFDDYVGERDATIVTRLLDAGATIVGKTNMDAMAVSGTGEVSVDGPIRNPRDEAYSPGGSSGGSAAAVVVDAADVALGTDQAGSIRVPAAWCGCVGLKPTYGLVPYTGVVRMGPSFDHVGPMARTVGDCAIALDAIAGRDPDDPRQSPGESSPDCVDAIGADPSDISVAVVEEGFQGENRAVDEAVRDALDSLHAAGADVTEVSVPWHEDAMAVWAGVVPEAIAAVFRDEGIGHFVDGEYDVSFAKAFAERRRERADDLAPTVRYVLLLGSYLLTNARGYYYGTAQNLRRPLRRAYDEALGEAGADVLALPTTPLAPYHRRPSLRDPVELVRHAQGGTRISNTVPFNMTGQPALSVPCGTADGLPVGMMLVGESFADDTVLRAGQAIENESDRTG